jgi:hypothetical protein
LSKSNYNYKKRQKEIAKKLKKEQKRQRKLEKKEIEAEDNQVIDQTQDQ